MLLFSFEPSVWLTENHLCHVFTRLKIHQKFLSFSIAHIDILVKHNEGVLSHELSLVALAPASLLKLSGRVSGL